MKYLEKPKREKIEKTFEFELKSPNNKPYSVSVLIKKDAAKLLGLKKGDKLKIHIKEFDDVMGYELEFKKKDTTKINIVNLDDITEKDAKNEKASESAKNPSANKPAEPDDNIYSNDYFIFKINNKKIKQILIYTIDNTYYTKIGITNRTDAEIKEIINKFILCKTKKEIKSVIREYKSTGAN